MYLLNHIYDTADRHRLFVLTCNLKNSVDYIRFFSKEDVRIINIGKELALFIDRLDERQYLTIEVAEYLNDLFDKGAQVNSEKENNIVVVYNFGLLLEPFLELNPVYSFKEFSKTSTIILLWEHQIDLAGKLSWPTQQQHYFLDFSGIPLKSIQHDL